MKSFSLLPKTERPSRLYILTISIIGWLYVLYQTTQIDPIKELWIFSLFILLIGICEYFPMPVWKGFSTISFPVVYVLYFIYGLPLAMVSYALIIFIGNLIDRRPFRIVSFNPAQLVLSFTLAVGLASAIVDVFVNVNQFFTYVSELFLMTFFFYVINNLLVDIVLLLRPQPYTFQDWKQKFLSELSSSIIAFSYGCFFLILGSQNRGEIDVFSFFFFFSPLIGLALLTSAIMKIKKERVRLKALFSLTTALNKLLPTTEWLDDFKASFHEIIDVEASLLWTYENGNWTMNFGDGGIAANGNVTDEMSQMFKELKRPYSIVDNRREKGPADGFFASNLRSFIYAPLVIDQETLGVLIVARSRRKSFNADDLRTIATIANQLAVIMKTRMLIRDNEKRSLLEERNRIARDIHDGVAQTIAGALMKLETAQRKWEKSPEETYALLTDSMDKLRGSLKQVRQSIYALRPYPTERVGLQNAIKKRIKAFEIETGLDFTFEERGKVEHISSMVEKILFDTFQESVQNTVKHAKATKVEVLLSHQKEHILLKIKDNGVGFSLLEAMKKAQREPHFGIIQMNDAVEKIGASLQIDSKQEAGTEISVVVPKMGVEGGIEDDQAHASG
ncbi:sensor histidine kinase [Bacillus suaedaesalsae]|uniref:sensor histidine kinase n=1 Tax=Bacillus suaedaesalsae TaxID=2810349 RepID=UPI001EF6BA47|nr:histidine kinase [Bacillus suaedaesalsae]